MLWNAMTDMPPERPPQDFAPAPAWKNMRWLKVGALTTGLLFIGIAYYTAPGPADVGPEALPPPALDLQNAKAGSGGLQSIVLAGGCFWGVQAVFEHVKGVREAVSGYSGGDADTADYKAVSTGRTGHAEAVKITFDPSEVSLGEILRIFFSVAHDPTALNHQGPDSGTQYRSDIFYADDAQRRAADAYIAQLDAAHRFPHSIVTRVDALRSFYPAEEIHQDYVVRNPDSLYVMVNDLPKLTNLKKLFPEIYRGDPRTVAAAEPPA
jgi:peptide-methionine (S)-S-oxide reductase